MKAALLAALLLCLPAVAAQRSAAEACVSNSAFCETQTILTRTDEPQTRKRSAAEIRAFKAENPCPSTGLRYGSCPNHQIDHVIPLMCNGPDTRQNMQWLTIQEHRWKTRTDVRVCRQLRKEATVRP